MPTPIYRQSFTRSFIGLLPTLVSQFHFINGVLSALADSKSHFHCIHSEGALSALADSYNLLLMSHFPN